MKQLNVPFIDVHPEVSNLYDIARLLDQQDKHLIDIAPWPDWPSKPEVAFSLAHTGNYILLKYFVRETYLRAANFEYNSPVYEDSCVECFLAFNEDRNYYNLEMNSTGCLRMGYGDGRANRQLLEEGVLRKISRQTAITRNSDRDIVAWELTAVVPVTIFAQHAADHLSGSRCRANFYKCGDSLPEAHFLCWSAINSKQPDFHLPEFFGELHFR
jgi:hypothetical protein